MSEQRMAVTDPTPDSIPLKLLEWFLSAIGGALATLVAFRTRLKIHDRRFDEQKERLAAQRLAIDEHKHAVEESMRDHKETIATEAMRAERAVRDSLEAMRRESDARHEDNRSQIRLVRRQQFLTLKMIADIARQTGADKRFDDEIWRALAGGQEGT
jgi:hypothetical protein